MPDDLLGPGGERINADSIRARLSTDHQAAIDAKLAEWFGDEADTYDADGLLELGRHRNQ